jgi:hypothetical protein
MERANDGGSDGDGKEGTGRAAMLLEEELIGDVGKERELLLYMATMDGATVLWRRGLPWWVVPWWVVHVLEETSTTWKTSTMKEMMKAIDDDDEKMEEF